MGVLRLGVAVVLLAGCYNPTPAPNAPCGPNGECPTGLMCNHDGLCVPPGGSTTPDAPNNMLDDADTDASALNTDAAIDGSVMPGGPPTFRSVVYASGFNSANVSINSPPGTQVGDLLFAHISQDGPDLASDFATPTGWTRVIDAKAVQDRFIVAVIYKYATATTESFTFSFTDAGSPATGGYIELMAFGGVHPTQPINASNISALDDTNQPTAPSVTTTKAQTMLVTMYAMDLSADSFQTVSGMTEIYDLATGDLQIGGDRSVVANAGATGTKVATRSGSDIGPTINATVALAPP